MKLIKKLILLLFIIVFIVLGIFSINGYFMYKKAISEIDIKDKVSSIFNNSDFISLNDIPLYYKNAVIAVEDHRFYEHGVVDFIAIVRATVSNIRSKDFVEGGSTITQQVAKNLYFIEEDDVFARKIAEIFVGYNLEKNYSKNQILELYINNIYYGNGYYNIKSASMGYFKKLPIDLTLDEATMLAGIPNAPSLYAPTVNMNLAKKRQQKVISSMKKYGYLDNEKIVN